MKKILLGTTALVAASMIAGQSQAADPVKLGLGGFMVQTFGYAEQDSSYEGASGANADHTGFDQKQTSEVHFKGSTKLDNGIGVAVQIEMNSDGGGNFSMDEVYMRLTSDSMGEIRMGQDDGAINLLGHRAPASGAITVNGGEVRVHHFITAPSAVSTQSAMADEQNDNKITYLSPTFMGFSAGISYNPDASNASLAAQPSGSSSAMSYAIAYNDTLAGVKVGADVGYMHNGQDGTDNMELNVLRGGLTLGYAGFTLGGSYSRWISDTGVQRETGVTSNDGYMWDAGLSYATGPYKIGVVHKSTEFAGLNTDTDEDQVDWTIIGATYTLGPGVSLTGDIMFADYEDEARATLANNNDGWAVNAGVVVSF